MDRYSESKSNLQVTSAHSSLPEDGLRILARIIVRHHKKGNKQLKLVDFTKGGAPYDVCKDTNG